MYVPYPGAQVLNALLCRLRVFGHVLQRTIHLLPDALVCLANKLEIVVTVVHDLAVSTGELVTGEAVDLEHLLRVYRTDPGAGCRIQPWEVFWVLVQDGVASGQLDPLVGLHTLLAQRLHTLHTPGLDPRPPATVRTLGTHDRCDRGSFL